MSHSHVLYHDVLMWDQPVDAVMTPLPPVLRGSQVEQQWGPLLKGKFSRTSAHVVKFCNGLDLLQFCTATVTENILHFWLLRRPRPQPELGYSPSSLVLGPLSTSSRVPGSLWGLSLNGGKWSQKNKMVASAHRKADFNTIKGPHQKIFQHSYQYSSPPAMHFS